MQTNVPKMFKTPAMVLDCDTVINDHHRHSQALNPLAPELFFLNFSTPCI